jgi:flagellar biosynthesis/type III secretory pathway protein FliH
MNKKQLKEYINKEIELTREQIRNAPPRQTKIEKTISFKVMPEDYDLIKERADQEGWSMSKLMRYCLYSEGITMGCK